MKKLALFLFGLFACLGLAQAASPTAYITATISITNAAGTATNETLTVNGDVRTWTNTVVVAASQILTNGTPSSATVNLLNQVALFPFSHLSLMQTAPTNIFLQSQTNMDLIVTLSPGWGRVTLATNNLSPAVTVRIPYTVESLAQRTNVASGMTAAINGPENTNVIAHATLADTASSIPGSLTNSVPSTNITLSTTAALASSGSVTNFAIVLLPGADDNLVQIYTVNTNVFITLSNTNKADWSRRVLLRASTNSLNSSVAFVSQVISNGNYGTVTAGTMKLLDIYNADTTGTNVIVTSRDFPGGFVTSIQVAVPAEFSSSGGPVTSSGTITIGKANESANTMFLGPTSGGAAAPTFRLMVAADIPSGIVANASLANSSITLQGSAVALGGSALAAGSSPFFNLVNSSNLTYQYTTNTSGSTTLNWGQATGTNIAANVTIALATPGASFYESAVYWVTNALGSDKTITSPSGVIGPVGSGAPSVLTATNKTITRILYEHFGPSQITVSKTDFGT